MKRNLNLVLAVVCLAVLSPACGVLSPSPVPGVLLSDDFSSPRWATPTDIQHTIHYEHETLVMSVFAPDLFVWSAPDSKHYQNLHVEVRVDYRDSSPDTRLGIICHQQSVEDNFYYFALTADGRYAIARAAHGQADVVLTNNGQWASSELITPDAATYHLGADCAAGALHLYVDGRQVASAFDTTYTNGGIALFAWSGAQRNASAVQFDDFLVTALP